MLKLVLFLSIMNAYANSDETFEKCQFKDLTSIESYAEKASKEVKLILAPHLMENEVLFDSWPVLCGSFLFELKQKPTKIIFTNWIACLNDREKLNKELTTKIQSCVKKVVF